MELKELTRAKKIKIFMYMFQQFFAKKVEKMKKNIFENKNSHS